jgi:hypothetical protein
VLDRDECWVDYQAFNVWRIELKHQLANVEQNVDGSSSRKHSVDPGTRLRRK